MDTKALEPQATLDEISVSVDSLDLEQATAIYKKHGCLLVRGLMKPYVSHMAQDIAETVRQAVEMLDKVERIPEGWKAPNGSLFIPAPEGYKRDKQIMTVGINYYTSATTTANRAEAEKRAAEARKTNEQRGLMVRGFRRYEENV